jgi:8-oxo-dGTP diphosphatase
VVRGLHTSHRVRPPDLGPGTNWRYEPGMEWMSVTTSGPIRHTIYRPGVERRAPVSVDRTAVRAIAGSPGRLLMIYSPVNGDYKFAGGGVETGETHAQALARELREETGYRLDRVHTKVAVITEYGHSVHDGDGLFRMESHYYFCEVDETAAPGQSLDGYEERLQFTPRWVSISTAIATNQSVLDRSPRPPRWTARETWLLRRLREAN